MSGDRKGPRRRALAVAAAVLATAFLPGAAMPAGAANQADGKESGESASARAYFAMGCFWSAEKAFESVDGVYDAVSGFAGGTTKNPTYADVVGGGTGHLETVRVTYDPRKLTYDDLLRVFWHNIDPFDGRGQFCDKGENYHAAIFPVTDEQRRLARESMADTEKALGRPVAAQILSSDRFYPAAAAHQNFYRTHAARYKAYSMACGRGARLAEVWGD